MTSVRRIALVALAASAAIAATAIVASAHAQYVSSTPAKGEVLDASPSQVSIVFTQEVQKISGTYGISVRDAAGNEHTSAPASLDDADRTRMSVPLQADLPPGRYVVSWTNVSDADGDPAEGAFSFYVGMEPTEADLAADAELAAEDEEPTPAISSPVASDTPASPPTDAPVDTPESGDDDGGGSGIWIVVIAAVVGAGAGFVAVRWLMARRR